MTNTPPTSPYQTYALSACMLTHTKGPLTVLSFGHKHVWVANGVRWLAICVGVVAFSTAEIISKCPTLIWGLCKEPSSWVNSTRGHSREACMGVQLQYHLSDLWVCSPPSLAILGLGVHTNGLLEHIFMTGAKQCSNVMPRLQQGNT